MPFSNRFNSVTLPPGAGSGETRIVVGADTPPELQSYGITVALLFYITKFETGVEIGYFFIGLTNQIDAGVDEAILVGTVKYPVAGDPSSPTMSDVRTNFQVDMFETIGPSNFETIFKDRNVWFKNTVGEVLVNTIFRVLVPALSSVPGLRVSTTGNLAGNRGIELKKDGDTNPGWFIDFDGGMQWGAGGASSLDANIKRTAAGELATESLKGLVSGSADAWHSMTLSSPWTNRGTGYPVLSYRKLASPANSVQIVGQVAPNGASSGSTIATLPSGYRPTTNIAFECGSDSANRALLEAESGGAIKAYSNAFGSIVQINTLIPLDL